MCEIIDICDTWNIEHERVAGGYSIQQERKGPRKDRDVPQTQGLNGDEPTKQPERLGQKVRRNIGRGDFQKVKK